MKTMMLLVLPAVALLITLSVANPTPHNTLSANHMIDMVKEYEKSIKEDFVEDVSPLTEGPEKCGNKFFCKVHEVLENHEKTNKHHHEVKKFVHALEEYVHHMNVNCTETLTNVTTSKQTRPIPVLLENLDKCCKHQNLNRAKKSDI